MKKRPVVVVDPEIMGGTPCFAGTRVPVRTLLDHLEAGDGLDTFLEDFPTVSRKQAIAFLEESAKAMLTGILQAARMRVLLDECLPARLRRDLPGYDVQTVPQAGWASLKNGQLLRRITVSGTVAVFLTMDKSLPHQQKVTDLPFAVVVLRARSNRFADTHPLMPEVLRRLAEFRPGHLYVITGKP